jgi:hypothetical protein
MLLRRRSWLQYSPSLLTARSPSRLQNKSRPLLIHRVCRINPASRSRVSSQAPRSFPCGRSSLRRSQTLMVHHLWRNAAGELDRRWPGSVRRCHPSWRSGRSLGWRARRQLRRHQQLRMWRPAGGGIPSRLHVRLLLLRLPLLQQLLLPQPTPLTLPPLNLLWLLN